MEKAPGKVPAAYVSKCPGTTDADDNGNEENLERPEVGCCDERPCTDSASMKPMKDGKSCCSEERQSQME
jgi:hypothetical protein